MKRRPPDLVIEIVTQHTATVRGHRVEECVRRAGCAKQYAYRPPGGGGPCWTIPAKAAHDVVAAAEHVRGHADLRSVLVA